MKKLCVVFLIAALICLLTACASKSISDNKKDSGNSGISLNKSLITLDAGEWPENEYTAKIPQPKSGTVVRVWIDPDKEYCAIELSNITQSESEQYVETLKATGFKEMEKVAEEINSDYVSVGTLLSHDDTSLSIAYLENYFCISISRKR